MRSGCADLDCADTFDGLAGEFSQGDHDIACRIDGIGAMKLKSEFVRKV